MNITLNIMEKVIIIIVLSLSSTLCSFGQDTLKGHLSFEYYYGNQIREKENAYKSKPPFFIFSD